MQNGKDVFDLYSIVKNTIETMYFIVGSEEDRNESLFDITFGYIIIILKK